MVIEESETHSSVAKLSGTLLDGSSPKIIKKDKINK